MTADEELAAKADELMREGPRPEDQCWRCRHFWLFSRAENLGDDVTVSGMRALSGYGWCDFDRSVHLCSTMQAELYGPGMGEGEGCFES